MYQDETIDDRVFRYVRVLRGEFPDYGQFYNSEVGWLLFVSKTEAMLNSLANVSANYAKAYDAFKLLMLEQPLNWDVIHRSKNLDKVIDILRDIRMNNQKVVV
jgi:hypothetical protein